MTRYEAFIDRNWRESSIHSIIVARIRSPSDVEIGIFLVDRWCLGIKDAGYRGDQTEADFEDMVGRLLPEETRERIHPAWAKKLIEGAVKYAEGLSFAPHHDYRKARRVLGGIDAGLCTEIFTFGKDGKPCYVAGEFDTPERIERVLAMLKARCGEDGYHYIVPQPLDDGDDLDEDDEEATGDAREALIDFFASEPDDAPGFFEFSGMVTALHVCPQMIMPGKLLERFWGPAGHEWERREELGEFMASLQLYWNDTADRLAGSLDAPPEEAWPIDLVEDEADDAPVAARSLFLWCRGFMRATIEWPEAWGDALTRTDLAPHWAIVRALADPEGPGNLKRIREVGQRESAEMRGQTLPLAIVALYRALRKGGTGQSD